MNGSMRWFLGLLAQHGLMRGTSWLTWRAVLIATVGEDLTPDEAERFRIVADRRTEDLRVALLAAFVGRRGGKDTAAAVMVAYLALCRRWSLAPGEVGTVLVLAVDRDQAQVAFKRILGILQAVPLLAAEIVNVTRESIELANGIEIKVATADGAAVRGRTLVAAVLDEFAFMAPDAALELLRALRPATATTPGSLIAIITTIYASEGPAFELFRQWGAEVPGQLIVKGTTRDFNPTILQSFIDHELALDPQGAAAEYLTIPRTDISRLFDAPLIDGVTRGSPRELPCVMTLRGGTVIYHAGVDVSGGRGDAASAAVAHMDGDRVILDAVRFWPAPHDPLVVAGEVAKFLALYGLEAARADQYAAEFARSAYREAGVTLMDSEHTRSEVYLAALPLFTTGRIELPPDDRLRRELLALERRTSPSGRDTVDHPRGGHDDVANAAMLAAVAAYRPAATGEGLHIYRSTALSGLDYGDSPTVTLHPNGTFTAGGYDW